jgi:hypothetical protein
MNKKIGELTFEIQKRIQEIAYLSWESAGRQQGMAMEYWLAAEREVLKTMQTAVSAMTRSYEDEVGGEKPSRSAGNARSDTDTQTGKTTRQRSPSTTRRAKPKP